MLDDIEPVRDSDLTCCMSVAVGTKSSLDLTMRLVVVVVVVRRSVVVARLEPLKAAKGSSMIEPTLESGVDSLSALIMFLIKMPDYSKTKVSSDGGNFYLADCF